MNCFTSCSADGSNYYDLKGGQIHEQPKTIRPCIEGYVTLKRKTTWVRRYVIVENCNLSYRSNKDEKKDKMTFDLRNSKVMLG